MAAGRAAERWQHTATVAALLANIPLLVWGKAPRFEPNDFNPFAPAAEAEAPAIRLKGKEGIKFLKELYGDRPYQAGKE